MGLVLDLLPLRQLFAARNANSAERDAEFSANADAKVKHWIERDDASLRFTLGMLAELAAQKSLDYPTASVAVRRLSMLSAEG